MTVAYDPRTKKRISQALHDALYQPINNELQRTLDSMIRRNSIACNNDQICFKYKGKLYTSDPSELIPRPANWLKQEFYTEMEEYLDERKTLDEDELPYVTGYITQVLNSSDSFKDYYSLFPEGIHYVLRQIQAECPCRRDTLDKNQIDRIRRQNVHPVNLLKKRVVINGLLTR